MTQLITEPTSHQQGEHTRSAVERIAAFAAAARPEHLTNDTRQLFKRNILDSLGCAIAALPGTALPGAARTVRGIPGSGPVHVDRRRQDIRRSGGALQLRSCALRGSARQLHGAWRTLSSE